MRWRLPPEWGTVNGIPPPSLKGLRSSVRRTSEEVPKGVENSGWTERLESAGTVALRAVGPKGESEGPISEKGERACGGRVPKLVVLKARVPEGACLVDALEFCRCRTEVSQIARQHMGAYEPLDGACVGTSLRPTEGHL